MNKYLKKRIVNYLGNEFARKGKFHVLNKSQYNVWEDVVPLNEELRERAIELLYKEVCTTIKPTQEELRLYIVQALELAKSWDCYINGISIEALANKMEFTVFPQKDPIYQKADEILSYVHGCHNYKVNVMHIGWMVYDEWLHIAESPLRNVAYELLAELLIRGRVHDYNTYEVIALVHDIEMECNDQVFL